MKQKRKRLWALFLSAALIVTQLPAVAMAENNVPEDGSIASFEELPSGVAEQAVPVGTKLSGLTLPDTVMATVYHVTEDTVIPDKVNGGEADREGGLGREDDMEDENGDASTASPSDAEESASGNHAGDSSEKDSGETVTTVTTSEEEIPVTWDSEPAFDGDTAGTYVFTADVGGYALTDGTEPPRIIVTVAEEIQPEGPPENGAQIKTVTGWKFVDDENLNEGELPLTSVNADHQADFDTVVSMLPTRISAEIESETDPELVDITGWNCDEYKQDGRWPLAGTYTFTAALADGYACDPLPAVKVLLGGAELFTDQTFDGLTVKTTSGEAATQETDGQIKLDSGDYEISGTWNGTLDGVAWDNKKAVITVPSGVTANVKLMDVTITNVSGTDYACAFAVAANGTANITLSGKNTLTSGFNRAGLEVPENAKVTIDGTGSLTVNGGYNYGAGIGGGLGGIGGTIEISGGTVKASSYYGAGIGGGDSGSGGTITISGGTVKASSVNGAGIGGGDSVYGPAGSGGTVTISGGTVTASSIGGAGIGGGFGVYGGNGGTITISGGMVTASSDLGAGIGGGLGSEAGDGGQITIDGNTVVFATSDQAAPIGGGKGIGTAGGEGTKALNQGVVFEDSNGTVYGSPELPGDMTIPSSSTLAVPKDSILSVPEGTVITNYGHVSGDGTITNNETINDFSNGITVTVTGNPINNKPSEVNITFQNGQGGQITRASYGDAITVQAEVSRKNTRLRTAAPNEVIFKIGSTVLGTANVVNSTATLPLTLTGDSWKPGSYTITAEYGGGADLLPNDAGTATLTVEKRGRTISLSGAPTVDGTNVTLAAAVLPEGSGDGAVEYGYAAVDDVSQVGNWQSGAAFTGLQFETKYYFFAKVAEGVFYQQAVSSGLEVTTGKATNAVTGVTLDHSAYTLSVNQTVSLTATVQPDNATDKSVSWTSSNPNVATVDANGKVTAHAAGTAEIAVITNDGGKTAICKITVSQNGGGNTDGSISYIEPEPQSSYTVAGDNISRSVSRSDLKKLADTGKSLTLSCDKAGMTFDPAALKAILAAVPSGSGDIIFAAAPADLSNFPDAAKQIGTRPVYDFTISYKDSKGNLVTVPVNFPAGSVAITLAYTPAAGEVTGSLFMVYVDGKGAMTWLDKSSYDAGKVMAGVPHFSTYGVAYKTPVPVFTDIAGHWAKEDIEFVAARGLLSGTGNNQFSPDGTMTRGMFVTALGRLAGVNPDSYKTRSFTDVKADAYYAAYVEWAAQKNIVKGTGDKLFSPDAPVTREQMAVMMTNYAGQMGYSIPTPLAAVTFADSNQISAWAAKEVAAMQRAGIVKGKDGNRFDPQASATRAEVSAVLRRFVEIVIDPATATGWIKNDSGHWLYYKGGKALTGWKEIGGKWYYFDENGVMAVNTKVDGYEIGPDGKRKED